MSLKNNNTINVLQIIDNLGYGGAENMAVQIANTISAAPNINSFICATREGGVYEANILPAVKKLILAKKKFLDFEALGQLRTFIIENNIQIIQAHSSSIFWAVMLKLRIPTLRIMWHNHSGMSEFAFGWKYKLRNLPLKLLKNKINYCIAVNENLHQWNMKYLGLPSNRSYVLLNYPVKKSVSTDFKSETPKDKTIICLANIRSQKGHPFLIESINKVFEKHDDWHLILVGKDFGGEALEALQSAIDSSPYKDRIHALGGKPNVGDYLANSAIGVLSSSSEGLPVALLEYGLFHLPVVSTSVGQIPSVLKDNGILVEYGDVDAFSNALSKLIQSENLRNELGNRLHKQVFENYSEEAAKSRLLEIYSSII